MAEVEAAVVVAEAAGVRAEQELVPVALEPAPERVELEPVLVLQVARLAPEPAEPELPALEPQEPARALLVPERPAPGPEQRELASVELVGSAAWAALGVWEV